MTTMTPAVRPANACFSSGPCAKRPGWTPTVLHDAALGRSHRAKIGKAKLKLAIDLTREVLGVPGDYRIGITPASDTGAVEMALWSLLGARGVDVLAWESFGEGWVTDVVKELKLKDARTLKAPYGELPDLAQVDFDRDVVFTWNGTTSGVRVPDANWIPSDRKGLTICDATSAAFAQDLDWPKLDVATFSWQKVLGGEAAHGVIVLSPRAVERLQTYTPAWPLPKIFRLAKGGKLIEGIFEGETINTPSMLCVEDYIDALQLGEVARRRRKRSSRAPTPTPRRSRIGSSARPGSISSRAFPRRARTPASASRWSIPPVAALPADGQAAFAKALAGLLEKEKVAFDIGSYRDAPPGLRIWCGATVEADDVEALTHWLDYAFALEKGKLAKAA